MAISAITISGQLLGVNEKPRRSPEQKQTFVLQVLCQANGGQAELLNISTKDALIAGSLRSSAGKIVCIPVGVFSPVDSSNVIFFVAQGTRPDDVVPVSDAK